MVEACRNNLHWSLWENQVIASVVFQIPNCTDWPQAREHEHYKHITPHKMRAINWEVPSELLLFREENLTPADVQALGLNLAPESSWHTAPGMCCISSSLERCCPEVLAVQLLCDRESILWLFWFFIMGSFFPAGGAGSCILLTN